MGEISKALQQAREEERSARESQAGRLSPGVEREDREEPDEEALRSSRSRPTPSPNRPTREAPPSPTLYHEIPRDRSEGWPARIVVVDPMSPSAARFRHLAVKMRAQLDKRAQASVLVTSAVSQEGKTTVSVNLALALASIAPEQRIALVDLDMHRGSVTATLQLEPHVGIEAVMSGRMRLDDVRVKTDLEALDIYPTAQPERAVHELLGGEGAAETLRELTLRYDYVICDGPPILPVPDVPLLAPLVGGCLVVVRSRTTRRRDFREVLELLPRPSIVGVFVNDVRSSGRSGSGYSYYEDKGKMPESTEPASPPAGSEEA
jgi:receptor protein-tyrosine kinase